MLLSRGLDRRFGVARMIAGMLAAVRRVVDAGAGDADGPAHAAAAHRDVRAAYPDRYARSRFRQIDRQPREDPQPPVKSEIAHRPSLGMLVASPAAKKFAQQRGAFLG